MMKTNINLLDLDNDILNIIGGYVIEDNIKNECLKQWIEIYTKKKIIKDLDKEIAILKHKDETGELLGNLIHDKLNKKIFSFDEILNFWLDRDLMVKCIEKDKKTYKKKAAHHFNDSIVTPFVFAFIKNGNNGHF